MNMVRPTAGDSVLISATIVQPAIGGAFLVEMKDHTRLTIPSCCIVGIDRKKPGEGSVVESILPSRQNLVGVVLFVDGADAFVRWTDKDNPEGRPTVENIASLRITHVSPA